MNTYYSKENADKIMYNEISDRGHIDKLYELVESQGQDIITLQTKINQLEKQLITPGCFCYPPEVKYPEVK